MDKEDVAQTDRSTMEYYSATERNKIVPSAEKWMDPESVIQNEEKNRKRKTNINTYMWILEKWQMNLFAGQE